MKKICMLVIALAMLALTACGQQEPAEVEMKDINEVLAEEFASDFDSDNVMSFEAVDEYVQGGNIYIKIQGTNNADCAVGGIEALTTLKDESGNIIYSGYMTYQSGVLPGTSFIESMYVQDPTVEASQIASVSVDQYTYKTSEPNKDGNNLFVVDLIMKTSEAHSIDY